MAGFNLSQAAIRHRSLVIYAMLVIAIGGWYAYLHLGQSEDPPFTFKVMVVRTQWPGASAREVAEAVSEPIEKTLLETAQYQFVRSYSRPGESVVMFIAKDTLRSADLPPLWYQVRKKVGDMRHELPAGVSGPYFNDEFGDVFGNIYALTGADFDYATLRDYAQRLQLELQRVPDVAKVDLIGLQDEKVWIELSNTKLASLGVPLAAIQQAIEAQNARVATGFFETNDERVHLRVSGAFDGVDDIREFPIRAAGRTFRIGDIAEVRRGFADPPAPRMRFLGEDAIGIGVAMREGGDIIALGHSLDTRFDELQQRLPVGMQLQRVTDQPRAVQSSVGEFIRVLAEAIAIVLLVCFLSLGLRTGLVVALSIPLVLAMSFALMAMFDIGLHKISLGALVLALGLLVDDAIIAIEMMAVKMEQGFDRMAAAGFAWQSTAFPMLTGTLITVAGFLPIATAASSTGEYTRSLFQVVAIALIVSWLAAVVFVPYLGYRLLPEPKHPSSTGSTYDPYGTAFYRRLRSLIGTALDHRGLVVMATVALFVVSIGLFRFVPQQFFPSSTRLELMVDLELAEGSSLTATDAAARRFEAALANIEGIENSVAFVGTGAPRFYLPLDQQLPAAHFSQFIIKTATLEDRERVRTEIRELLDAQFTGLRSRVTRLENGPPVGYPIQYRVIGEHVEQVRSAAREIAALLRTRPELAHVSLDWEAPSKVVRIVIDQERARALEISSAEIAGFLQGSLSGLRVSTLREGDQQIGILLRGPPAERASLRLLGSVALPVAGGESVVLDQIATLEYGFEEGVIWHRNALPAVTVRADIADDSLPAGIVANLRDDIDALAAGLPAGYRLETGGSVEDAGRGQASVNAGVPLFLLVVMTLLMVQLRSVSRSLLVLATAPLGLIGVVVFLLVGRVPFGFVAMLGTIALSGMIMRNTVILVDQIEQDLALGHDRRSAVIDATVRRFRPIVLTALAAVMAMIPLSRSVFFGPMAVAIMGGLIFATGLTIVFVPALYALWFRVPRRENPAPPAHSAVPAEA